MKFYLGTHQPSWLACDLGIPLMVSHRRLAGRRRLPRASSEWALDSGGFSELGLYGTWVTSAKDYVVAVRRYAEEIGNLTWAAPMDWMCEPAMLAKTKLTVLDHQQLTVDNFLRLRDLAPELPIVPVVHGDTAQSYLRCVDLYEANGIRLGDYPTVGVGSVCRRQRTHEVETIMRSLADRGLRLHGFGVKITGLGRCASALASADSMGWSLSGRYVPGCTPSHRTESNCLRYALSWHARLHATLPTTPADPDPPACPHQPAGPEPRTPSPRTRPHPLWPPRAVVKRSPFPGSLSMDTETCPPAQTGEQPPEPGERARCSARLRRQRTPRCHPAGQRACRPGKAVTR
ncbi:hypothetical protein M8C13_09105 [Crossiella sp. SN42]|uniref:deazapurine DNA modification protein DpdA family protein n=1 Tax=Crossiella sp. SN42 TaxID=2944808 RepID=UPI00207C6E87|nr:hypothetical protein [Crossiella sp. SN42]MCO1575914.1 hypothetical protein [Crossiella sp. SN42]